MLVQSNNVHETDQSQNDRSFESAVTIDRVPTVTSGNFQGVGDNREGQGILKYRSLDQLFMHYFHNFCQLLGALL